MGKLTIKNREEIIEKLVELLIQFDKDCNRYQTDVYLYYDGENQTAELDTFVNVGGNSWLNDDHYTIYCDKEHYETVWDWFNNSTEIADVLEYSTYTEFDLDVRKFFEMDSDETPDWDDYITFVKLNNEYMEKILESYNDYIDELRPEYIIKAEEIMEQFDNECKFYEGGQL